MEIRKAVITSAAAGQRHIPLQTLVSQDGVERSVLEILIAQVAGAGIEQVGVVISPGDEASYLKAAGDYAGRLRFMPQNEPRGYAQAVYCARAFAGNEPFLHLVGDHVYVSKRGANDCAALVEVAAQANCSVSAVQVTRESLLPYYGTVAAERVPGQSRLYRISSVIEKPSPTVAEQNLRVPGLRAGHYLCFFGMHVLTPTIFDLLEGIVGAGSGRASLSAALGELPEKERYLAFEATGSRMNLGQKYGMLNGQLALALAGCDRAEVLANVVQLLAASDPSSTES